ncbi:MAG: tetratricopeptide repeat protein, partial [Thermomicrobiales bacterium]
RYQSDYANDLAALAWTLEHHVFDDGVLQALDGMTNYWTTRGPQSEGAAIIERFLTATREETRERAVVSNLAGMMARQRREYPRAAALHDESYRIANALGDRLTSARALHNRGVVASQTRDFPNATEYFEASQALFRDLGDRAAVALSLYNQGVIAERTGEFERATVMLEEALTLHEALGDTDRVAMSLFFLGQAAAGQGDLGASLQLHEEAVALWKRLNAQQTVAQGLFSVARLQRLRGNPVSAISTLIESLDLIRIDEDRWHTTKCVVELAAIAASIGDRDHAERLHDALSSLPDWRTIPFRADELREYDELLRDPPESGKA